MNSATKSLEKDFSDAVELVKKADLLLFSYPVYTFIAPCQLHKFIELMKEHNVNVEGGHSEEECASILQSFFKSLRKKKKEEK